MKNLLLIILVVFTAGCAAVQYTNRNALILVSPQEETAMGVTAFKEVMKKEVVSKNPQYNALVTRVGQRVAAVADRPDYKWEFIVLDDPKQVNAFCLPGGKVVFYTGILPVCKDENGVAVVMAHEVAHALARHGAERVSQQLVASLVQDVLSATINTESAAAKEAVLIGYGVATKVGVLLPHNRTQESEADFIGLILMAKAGYDPRPSVDFWIRMKNLQKNNWIPAFLSTHPTDDKRIKDIESKLPEAMTYYKEQGQSAGK